MFKCLFTFQLRHKRPLQRAVIKWKQMPQKKCKRIYVVLAYGGHIQIYQLIFNSSSIFILGTNCTCEELPIREKKRPKRSGENEWSRSKSRIWLNIRTNFKAYLFSFRAPITPVKCCKCTQKRVQKEWMVSPQIKNLTKLGTNLNSRFLSFWAPIAPRKKSHKEKIVALNKCKKMKAVAVNQGPCLT